MRKGGGGEGGVRKDEGGVRKEEEDEGECGRRRMKGE